MMNLYANLGGPETINAIIDRYFEYVLSDSNLKPFYKNSNMQSLKIRYKQYFQMIVGGPQNYHGKKLKEAHQKHQISKIDFYQAWKHMQKAMNDYEIADVLIKQMKKLFISAQNQVTTIQKENTLYERLGGQTNIGAFVDKFYEFMLNDPLTSPYFANVDMKKQRQLQKQFIIMITGGPNKYEGKDMKTAHKMLKIENKEFDQTWHNLEKALTLYKVNKTQIKELKNILYLMEKDIAQN